MKLSTIWSNHTHSEEYKNEFERMSKPEVLKEYEKEREERNAVRSHPKTSSETGESDSG